jgi:phosphoglycerate dehydrogenase-like enzyme
VSRKIVVTLYKMSWPGAPSLDALRQAGFEVKLNTLDRYWTDEELAAELVDAYGVIAGGETYAKSTLDTAKHLKVIARMGVGYDKIDLEYCRRRGIVVTAAFGTNHEAVADFAFSLMLGAASNIVAHATDMRAGVWKNTQHLDIFGQTIGVLGLGRIGRAMARRAAGFNMVRLYWDLERKADAEAEGIAYRPLDDLLAASDFVSVHLPYTPQTANILGRAEFARMKPTAILVNTARGGIVDEAALFDALSNGAIAGAASDVFAAEPANGPLVRLPNFIGTPHCAAATPGAYRNMAASCVDSILTVNAGKLPARELVLVG